MHDVFHQTCFWTSAMVMWFFLLQFANILTTQKDPLLSVNGLRYNTCNKLSCLKYKIWWVLTELHTHKIITLHMNEFLNIESFLNPRNLGYNNCVLMMPNLIWKEFSCILTTDIFCGFLCFIIFTWFCYLNNTSFM